MFIFNISIYCHNTVHWAGRGSEADVITSSSDISLREAGWYLVWRTLQSQLDYERRGEERSCPRMVADTFPANTIATWRMLLSAGWYWYDMMVNIWRGSTAPEHFTLHPASINLQVQESKLKEKVTLVKNIDFPFSSVKKRRNTGNVTCKCVCPHTTTQNHPQLFSIEHVRTLFDIYNSDELMFIWEWSW